MKYSILSVLLAVALTAWAQPPDTLWTRSYNVSTGGQYQSITATPNGGFVITYCPNWPYDAGLLQLDSAGEVQWQRTYGVPETFETFSDVKSCPAGGYVAVGSRFGHPTYDDSQTYVVRTDEQGDTLWTRTSDVQDEDDLYSVAIAANGDLICVGRADYQGAVHEAGDVLIMRYTDAGDLMWTARYRGNLSSSAYDIVRWGDGDQFLVGGRTGRFWEDDSALAYVLAVDGNGDTLWTRTYGLDVYNQCYALAATNDGGFVFAGQVTPDPNLNPNLLVIRADSLGRPLWSNHYGPGAARKIDQARDGGFAVFFGSGRYAGVGSQYGLKRLSATGDTLWTGLYGTAADNYLASGLALPDQSYILLGAMPGTYVVRTLPEPLSATDPPPPVPVSPLLLSAYPNPFNATTMVTYWLPRWAWTQLTVYDILGRQIQTYAPAWLPPGNHQLRLACEGWSSGPYVLRLESGKEATTVKLLLEK